VIRRGFLRLFTVVAGQGAARLALRARLNAESAASHVD